MSASRYLLGVVLLVAAFAPITMGAIALRRRLLRGWDGPPAVLADIVIALALIIVVSEALGVIGAYDIAPLTLALAIVGAAVWYGCRRNIPAPVPPIDAPRAHPAAVLASFAAVAAVVAGWSTQWFYAVTHGPTGIDTFWYHLPVAARFVQAGSISGVHYFESDGLTAFFPANAALLHGLGMLAFGNDLLSPFLNMGFLALAFLAAWCIGRPFGLAPATMTGLAVVMGTPMLVGTQPGTGYNDTIGIALMLAAVAILVTGSRTSTPPTVSASCVAAAAAGIAFGTKLQFIVPVAALALGVVIIGRRGDRLRHAISWAAIVVALSGVWYVRNFVTADNPVPLAGVNIGPLRLPKQPILSVETTLESYLFDRRTWDLYLRGAFEAAFGPAWWAVLGLLVVGGVAGVVSARGRTHRMLVIVGIVSIAAWLWTPAAYGADRPVFAVYQSRYAAFALSLGFVLLPLALRRGRSIWWLLVPFLAVIIATQFDPGIWPTNLRHQRFGEPVHGASSVAGFIFGVVVLALATTTFVLVSRHRDWRPLARRYGRAVAAVSGIVIFVGGFGIARYYMDHRYAHTAPMPQIYRWASTVHDERIAVAGYLTILQYPLYGDDLSNYVQYIVAHKGHGAVAPVDNCVSWRRAINRGRFSYVLIGSNGPSLTPRDARRRTEREDAWTRSDRAAVLTRREVAVIGQTPKGAPAYLGFSLYRVVGRFDTRSCPAPTEGA